MSTEQMLNREMPGLRMPGQHGTSGWDDDDQGKPGGEPHWEAGMGHTDIGWSRHTKIDSHLVWPNPWTWKKEEGSEKGLGHFMKGHKGQEETVFDVVQSHTGSAARQWQAEASKSKWHLHDCTGSR